MLTLSEAIDWPETADASASVISLILTNSIASLWPRGRPFIIRAKVRGASAFSVSFAWGVGEGFISGFVKDLLSTDTTVLAGCVDRSPDNDCGEPRLDRTPRLLGMPHAMNRQQYILDDIVGHVLRPAAAAGNSADKRDDRRQEAAIGIRIAPLR